MPPTLRRLARLGACLAFTASTAHAATGEATVARHDAIAGDTTVAKMVSRWTAEDGRPVAWQAFYDVPLLDPLDFASAIALQQAPTTLDAVWRVNSYLTAANPRFTALQACVYPDGPTAIVVRTVRERCQ